MIFKRCYYKISIKHISKYKKLKGYNEKSFTLKKHQIFFQIGGYENAGTNSQLLLQALLLTSVNQGPDSRFILEAIIRALISKLS